MLQITDDQLTEFAEEMIAGAIRDLMHERMGQCEQLGDAFDGFGDLTEDEQDTICERLEATLQTYPQTPGASPTTTEAATTSPQTPASGSAAPSTSVAPAATSWAPSLPAPTAASSTWRTWSRAKPAAQSSTATGPRMTGSASRRSSF